MSERSDVDEAPTPDPDPASVPDPDLVSRWPDPADRGRWPRPGDPWPGAGPRWLPPADDYPPAQGGSSGWSAPRFQPGGSWLTGDLGPDRWPTRP